MVTRGATEVADRGSRPGVRSPGIFDDGDVPSLIEGPIWTTLTSARPPAGSTDSWSLDMASGLLHHRLVQPASKSVPWLESTRLVSLVRPGLCLLRARLGIAADEIEPPLCLPGRATSRERPPALSRLTHISPTAPTTDNPHGIVAGSTWSSRAALAAAATQWITPVDAPGLGVEVVRLAVYRTGATAEKAEHLARGALTEAQALGVDELVAEHREAWRRRWESADIAVSGDDDLTGALRFALFHLMSACPGSTATNMSSPAECALGARGATGPAYHGHVFWDTDVFVQPALTPFLPEAARATLLYRHNRLAAARRLAAEKGRQGARFPWESADVGVDVTPRWAPDLHGGRIPILTGEMEEHISADIAWAAVHYTDWTSDPEIARSRGPQLVTETARYWASRIEIDPDGTGHIRHVIGPDEYHEDVADNAYTNLMVRWNLNVGADELERDPRLGQPGEMSLWRDLATRLVTGFRPEWGGYEQFEGWSELEDVKVSSLGRPPLAADLLLGHDHIGRTRIIKQADVVMAHQLVPYEMEPGSLQVDIERYLPYTAHGSSLSPAIHASVLARAGRTAEALDLLAVAARLDLDDITGTTSGGLHFATMGGLIWALLSGFLRIDPCESGFRVDPHLPEQWQELRVRFRFRARHLSLRASDTRLTVELLEGKRLDVFIGSGPRITLTSGAAMVFERKGGTWSRTS